MNLKEQLIEFLKGKDSISLKEIYQNFPNTKKESIRATINLAVKKNECFERISKGKYKVNKNEH